MSAWQRDEGVIDTLFQLMKEFQYLPSNDANRLLDGADRAAKAGWRAGEQGRKSDAAREAICDWYKEHRPEIKRLKIAAGCPPEWA